MKPASKVLPEPDFGEIRSRCHGFMKADIYADLYRFAAGAAPGEAVEVGCAHGASTVCIGLGMAGNLDKLTTFGRFGTGRRAGYQDAERNLPITRAAIAHYGLADKVNVIDGDVDLKFATAGIGKKVTMVFLDADGRIDRDLELLAQHLVPGARIAIDDYADRARPTRISDRVYTVQQKHRLTKMLVDSAMAAGALREDHVTVGTWFGYVYPAKLGAWSASAIMDCYAGLIKCTVEI